MWIHEIILEGFKSYSRRTVLKGFDSSFTAITVPLPCHFPPFPSLLFSSTLCILFFSFPFVFSFLFFSFLFLSFLFFSFLFFSSLFFSFLFFSFLFFSFLF